MTVFYKLKLQVFQIKKITEKLLKAIDDYYCCSVMQYKYSDNLLSKRSKQQLIYFICSM